VRRVAGRIELADAQVIHGRVLATDGGLPTVVRRTLGRGTIWFLAFDPTLPPLAQGSGVLPFWRGILSADRLPVSGGTGKPAMDDPWISAFFAAAPKAFPPVYAVVAFVAAYLALLLPTLLVRRRIPGRTRLALLAAVCVAATVVGWTLFNAVLFHSDLQIMDVARVDARSGDGFAFVTEKTAFYAASSQLVTERVGLSDAVVEGESSVEPDLFLSQTGSAVVVKGIDLKRLGARLIAVQDAVPFDITARAQIDGATVQTFIRNGSTKSLRGCSMLVSGKALPLGDIPAGAEVHRTFAVLPGAWPSANEAVQRESDKRRATLFKAMEGETTEAGPPRLIGWMDGPVLPISFTGLQAVGGLPGVALVNVEAE